MIIYAKDLEDNDNIRGVIAGLGVTALSSSLSSIVFQFTDDGKGLESILVPEQIKVGLSGAISLRETGLDALFNMSAAKKLTAEDFREACMNLTSGKPFDVAEISKNEELKEIIVDRLDDIKTLLAGANEIYDLVFVIYDSAYEGVINALKGDEGIGLLTVDHYSNVNLKDVKTEKDYLILTDFQSASSFTKKAIGKANGIKNGIYSLSYPVALKDAKRSSTLYKYLKEVRNADKDITDPAAEFITELKGIVLDLAGNKKIAPVEDIWDSFAEPIEVAQNKELTASLAKEVMNTLAEQ
jgi:hypothetical protein